MMKKGISLVGFRTYDEVSSYIKAYPNARFELSYNMKREFLSSIAPLIEGRVLSLHACCPEEAFFPNYGSYNPSVIEYSNNVMQKSLETAKAYGADIVVLHPGYITDENVSSCYRERALLMRSNAFKPFIAREEGSIVRNDILSDEEYVMRFRKMNDHVTELSSLFERAGVALAVENLNPRAGYLFYSPYEIANFSPNVRFCLDVGHLYISHYVFGFDFLKAIDYMLSTGRVLSMHLHSNRSDGKILEDSHSDFFASGFPSTDIIRIASGYDVNLILETISNPLENSFFLDSII